MFEFLNSFVFTANVCDLSEGQAVYVLPEFTKDTLKGLLYRMLLSTQDGVCKERCTY